MRFGASINQIKRAKFSTSMAQRKSSRSVVSPKNRAPVLTRLRQSKMTRSTHAYVRGSTVRFYEWLSEVQPHTFPEGPIIWICGDCHVGNLGPVGDASGATHIQIRDMDQTVLGNPAHDLIRLGVSPRGKNWPRTGSTARPPPFLSGAISGRSLARNGAN